jgi:probable addiction module antidote protein
MKTRQVDLAEYLETDEDICEFLKEASATCMPEEFNHVLNIAARAKGMTEIAKQAGVTRASLYKSSRFVGKPRFETISKIVNAFGSHLAVKY